MKKLLFLIFLLTSCSSTFTFRIENDVVSPTNNDEQYTNGVKISLQSNDSGVVYSIGQEMYTPDDIKTQTPDPHDRPYTGYAYVEAELTDAQPNKTKVYRYQLGITGKYSFAADAQKCVHRSWGKGVPPQGWHTQTPTEPILQISYEEYFKLITTGYLDFSYFRGFDLGNFITRGKTGLVGRIGYNLNELTSSSSNFTPPLTNGKSTIYLFMEGQANSVFYNITVNNKLFHKGTQLDLERAVYEGRAGIMYESGKWNIGYAHTWRTKEFQQDDKIHDFGGLIIGVRW